MSMKSKKESTEQLYTNYHCSQAIYISLHYYNLSQTRTSIPIKITNKLKSHLAIAYFQIMPGISKKYPS